MLIERLSSSSIVPAYVPVCVLAGIAMAANAQVVTIEFGPELRNPGEGIIHLDSSFDDIFEELGVRFSSPDGATIFWLGSDYGFRAAANTIVMGDPRTGENSTHPLRIDFLTPVNAVSIFGIDGGVDIDTLAMRAFTSDGTQVDFDTLSGNFGGGGTVSTFSDRIDYILVEQSGVAHGLFLDNLMYNQIPSPTPLAVLAIGGSLMARRRRSLK